MEDKTKKIIEAFKKSEKALKTAELSQLTGIDSKDVAKVIKKLKTDGKIESPKRCFYQIKK